MDKPIVMPQYHTFNVNPLTAWENHVANNIGGGICERRRRRAGITLP